MARSTPGSNFISVSFPTTSVASATGPTTRRSGCEGPATRQRNRLDQRGAVQFLCLHLLLPAARAGRICSASRLLQSALADHLAGPGFVHLLRLVAAGVLAPPFVLDRGQFRLRQADHRWWAFARPIG